MLTATAVSWEAAYFIGINAYMWHWVEMAGKCFVFMLFVPLLLLRLLYVVAM